MTQLIGILNITPDSFSDGGTFLSPEAAIHQAHKLVEEGAEIIDIGAESTRPEAIPLTPEQEWKRLEPVLKMLVGEYIISVDTRHPQIAAKAIAMGVSWINDVSGLTNKKMVNEVKESKVQAVIMHSLTIPVDKNIVMPDDCDVVKEVFIWAEEKIASLTKAGISKERIIIDPGIGFGKTAKQSWELIHRIEELKSLNVPLYIGHSRKSFFGGKLEDRDVQTCEVTAMLAQKGIDYIRVHDVAANKQAITDTA